MKIVRTKRFWKEWLHLGLSQIDWADFKQKIVNYIQLMPDNNFGRQFPGALLKNTGGAYKLRYSPNTSYGGKSGAYRIIYFAYCEDEQVLNFLMIYPKNRKETLTQAESNAIKKLITHYKKT